MDPAQRPIAPPAHVFAARYEPGAMVFAAPADMPLLLAAQQAGLDLRSSCRNGTCRSCICRLLEGHVVYRIEWPGLSAEEKAEGLILPCVAFPSSDLVLQAGSLAPSPAGGRGRG